MAARLEFDRRTASMLDAAGVVRAFNAHVEGHGRTVLAAYAPVLKEVGASLLAVGAAYQLLSFLPARPPETKAAAAVRKRA